MPHLLDVEVGCVLGFGVFDSQLELAHRAALYQVASEADRADFLDDSLEHSLPWLLKYETFDALWRALLHAELPGAMIPVRPARSKVYAQQALEVAFYHRLDPALTEEAIAYCWDRGFHFDKTKFDGAMSEIVNRLPLSRSQRN